jgi:hypothetical protein
MVFIDRMKFVDRFESRFPVLIEMVGAGDVGKVIEVEVGVIFEKLSGPVQGSRSDEENRISQAHFASPYILA